MQPRRQDGGLKDRGLGPVVAQEWLVHRYMDNAAPEPRPHIIGDDIAHCEFHMGESVVEPDTIDPLAGTVAHSRRPVTQPANTRMSAGAAAARKGWRSRLPMVGDGRRAHDIIFVVCDQAEGYELDAAVGVARRHDGFEDPRHDPHSPLLFGSGQQP